MLAKARMPVPAKKMKANMRMPMLAKAMMPIMTQMMMLTMKCR
jgi:hypothetical protein